MGKLGSTPDRVAKKCAFDYTLTSLGPTGCKISIHATSNKRKSWYQRVREGFSVGPALQNYRCIQAIDRKTKALIIIDTAEYLHEYLTQPHVTAEDRMTHVIHFLTASLKDVPTSICDSQLAALEAVKAIFINGQTIESSPHKKQYHHSYQDKKRRQVNQHPLPRVAKKTTQP